MNTPENPWKVDAEEQGRRVDLRNTHLVFSIDPKDCEDVDDALSVRKLANENLELGVHIADVTHFVKLNSYTDLEARSRYGKIKIRIKAQMIEAEINLGGIIVIQSTPYNKR